MTSESNGELLTVRDLRVWFPVRKGILARTVGHVKAVDGVSFGIRVGETLGVVGESGCGKSTTSRAILGLVKPTSGEILFEGRDVGVFSPRERACRIQAVFQDPLASLNPRLSVREIVTEGAVFHGLCPKSGRDRLATELMESVGLPSSALDRYPHEFSGGQRQRISLARAVSLRPRLLICDEAVSALDLSIRAQTLDLLADLRRTFGLSILFITHDLGVVQHIADRLIVMRAGKVIERGDCRTILRSPGSDDTRALVAAVPRIGKRIL